LIARQSDGLAAGTHPILATGEIDANRKLKPAENPSRWLSLPMARSFCHKIVE
jgi:hypothetical protein